MKIALSGSSGSGKGIVAGILTSKHGFLNVSTGKICRSISKLLFENERKENLNFVSTMIRSQGEHILIDAALRGVVSDRIVFDSIRYASDAPILREIGFKLWRINAPLTLRQERLFGRKQEISTADFTHESEISLDDCDFDEVIENENLEIEGLESQIERRIAMIVKKNESR